ncbi:hypothetical protein LB467_12710 [Salegentibacter sp. JZCK2]|uniref:hypothetical protein n=1 Tax=Salegentibacter tibetensis TaxID=2873600 RepID=UPI001CD01E0A|nr:hypothetical protein [Salegentibacter tibetensis]MBZ9730548.1 hypothetical protein [Salegentibacter tibetensis]
MKYSNFTLHKNYAQHYIKTMLKPVPNRKTSLSRLTDCPTDNPRAPARTVFIRDVSLYLKSILKNLKYLIKFIDCEYLPDFDNLESTSIKIGTFHHYRKIEDRLRRDEKEGQKGLNLRVKKPCNTLRETFKEKIEELPLDHKGHFIDDFYVNIIDHSYEFNSWVFCSSLVRDLSEIEKFKSYFNCECYYFITDYKKFENAIQKALVNDLKFHSLNNDGENRLEKDNRDLYYLSGKRQNVIYGNNDKCMVQECETFSEFIKSQEVKQVNSNFWFYKPQRFEEEKEFRFIIYATADKKHDKFYSTTDDFLILNCDLRDAISAIPVAIE